jgi:hypothetical protein
LLPLSQNHFDLLAVFTLWLSWLIPVQIIPIAPPLLQQSQEMFCFLASPDPLKAAVCKPFVPALPQRLLV